MAQRYKKEVVFELLTTISKTTSIKMVMYLPSEIHKIGIVNTEVETTTGNINTGSVVCESTELELT